MHPDLDRSLERIEIADLLRLAALAADAEAELFRRNPQGSGRYAGRLLGRALCQGGALHYVNGNNGVKDFDVWSFYSQYDDWPFPARWRGTRDFGPSRFGRFPGDPPSYSGRRVDFLGRSLPAPLGADPAVVIRSYLAGRRTESAKALAAKAVVLIDPEDRAGEIIWPAVSRRSLRLRLSPRCQRGLDEGSEGGDGQGETLTDRPGRGTDRHDGGGAAASRKPISGALRSSCGERGERASPGTGGGPMAARCFLEGLVHQCGAASAPFLTGSGERSWCAWQGIDRAESFHDVALDRPGEGRAVPANPGDP
jgi:hypothetical protein